MCCVLRVQRRSATELTEGRKRALSVDTNSNGNYSDILKNNNILTPQYVGETLDIEYFAYGNSPNNSIDSIVIAMCCINITKQSNETT